MELILNFELVPDSCWYSNLRSMLSQKQWDFIRKDAYARSGGKCVFCGAKGRLEAHEQWDYDEENAVQKLKDVIAVCPKCHEVIHIGRTQLLGKDREAEEQFMKVNRCTYADFKKALAQANVDHIRRNKVAEWKIDLSYLKRYVGD